MSRELLIDGDVLVYKYAHANQEILCWDWDLHFMYGRFEPAKTQLANFLDDLLHDKPGGDILTVVLSDSDANFRKQLDPGYKAARLGDYRPILYRRLREFLIEEYDALQEPTLEGDDMLGILATDPASTQLDRVICTVDKDLRTVPCTLYNWEAGTEETIGSLDAAYHHAFQTLTGDSTDGYKGCPGVGPVGARKLLAGMLADDGPHNPWPTILAAFQKKGLGEAVALQQARCAYILQHGDYDFSTKEIKLWTPDNQTT